MVYLDFYMLWWCTWGKGYTVYQNQNPGKDELRARFTKWMEVTLYRARKRYIRKREAELSTVALDDAQADMLRASQDDSCDDQFEFQQEALADAFRRLSPKKQRILTLLFSEELKPSEVARYLNCSPQQIYDQRYQALKALRKYLQTGGEDK